MKLSDYKNIKYINTQISDFCKIRNGYYFKSNHYSKSGIRVIRISDVQKGSISDNDIVFYPLKLKNEFENYLLTEKDILVSLTGNVGRVAMLKLSNLPAALNQRVAAISTNSNVINKYLYYCISNDKFENQCYEASTGGAQKNLSTKWLANYVVPIPDIKVQEEIVKILDSFTNLIDALNEELSLRQKQFEYYRDQLYDDLFKKTQDVDVLSFSELGQIERGKRFVRDDIKTYGQPCIHYGDMYTFYGVKSNKAKTYLDRDFPKKMRYADVGDVIIVGAGENNWDIGVGLAWLGEEPAAVHDACYIVKHRINPLFIAYYTRTTVYHQQLKKCVSEGKICSFSAEGLGKVEIPVPKDKAIQQSIVTKLDAFESLISSLKEEIALRQKQYEYYREKLLTFE